MEQTSVYSKVYFKENRNAAAKLYRYRYLFYIDGLVRIKLNSRWCASIERHSRKINNKIVSSIDPNIVGIGFIIVIIIL